LNRPQIFLRFQSPNNRYQPGDVVIAEYWVEAPSSMPISAVESSVIWTTSGKGEEDVGVHFFESLPKLTLSPEQLRRLHRISTVLPQSPLSYDGTIVQVRWSVRLRVFADGRQFSEDLPFRLGRTSREEYVQPA
jgi:hypothetical protein